MSREQAGMIPGERTMPIGGDFPIDAAMAEKRPEPGAIVHEVRA